VFTCGGRTEGTLLTTVCLDDNSLKSCPVKGSLKDAITLAGNDQMCGIVWGINGTCHTIANRLLWCCENHPTVRAPGWQTSFHRYGGFYGNPTQWVNYRKSRGFKQPTSLSGPNILTIRSSPINLRKPCRCVINT